MKKLFVFISIFVTISAVTATATAQEEELTCHGQTPTIVGTDGDDYLVGTDGNDVIMGLDGKDRIYGGKGNDIICGGRGADRIWGNRGKDVIYGDQAGDRIIGGAGDDILVGGPKRDRIVGGGGDDIIWTGHYNTLVYHTNRVSVGPGLNVVNGIVVTDIKMTEDDYYWVAENMEGFFVNRMIDQSWGNFDDWRTNFQPYLNADQIVWLSAGFCADAPFIPAGQSSEYIDQLVDIFTDNGAISWGRIDPYHYLNDYFQLATSMMCYEESVRIIGSSFLFDADISLINN